MTDQIGNSSMATRLLPLQLLVGAFRLSKYMFGGQAGIGGGNRQSMQSDDSDDL
jgi:hypothetical protein